MVSTLKIFKKITNKGLNVTRGKNPRMDDKNSNLQKSTNGVEKNATLRVKKSYIIPAKKHMQMVEKFPTHDAKGRFRRILLTGKSITSGK